MGDSRNLTRRTLLGGVAAAGAASLVRPAAGLADALRPSGSVTSRWVGSLSGESPAILAPRRFALVGIEWAEPAGARIELRAQAPRGRWSPWVIASALGHDPDHIQRRPGLFGEPAWTGPADRVQLRTNRSVAGVRLHFVSADVISGAPASAAAAFSLAEPILDAGPGQPPVIARHGWAQGKARPVHAPEYSTVKLAFVHHTVNPNGYGAGEVPALLRAIFDYHVQVRGFWDIAYNFLIDAFGRIWEGRAGGIDMAVIGAHAGGYNAESTGVAVLGDFMNVVPSRAAVGALEQLIAWKLSLHGLPTHGRVTVVVDPADYFYTPFAPGAHVSLPRVSGHRDGDSTDCPGNAFYDELPSIRPRITALAGTPARLRISPPLGVTSAGAELTVSGRLELLGGQPLAGAPIEVQELRPDGVPTMSLTLAAATTGADGSWSAAATLQSNVSLRALHRPQPAAVSDWSPVAVVPVITLTVQSASPLMVAGTIVPSKPHVTVDVYRTTSKLRHKPLTSKHVVVQDGRFAGEVPVPGPGSYVLVAVHDADAANAAGASAPVSVSVT